MTAWQRSNITVRTEKGIGPISFKRLLLAGGTAGIIAMISGRIIGFFPSCLSAGIVLALVLIVTHPVEGLPLFAFALRTLRGLATIAAFQDAGGSTGAVGQALRVSPQEGILDADAAYGAEWHDEDAEDLLDGDWEYLGSFSDVKSQGLSAAENPFGAKVRAEQ